MVKSLSIIVPTYNESENIVELLTRIYKAVLPLKIPYEIICIDDFSTDGTYELLKKIDTPNLVIRQKKTKRGKAFSLKQGFELAKYEAIAMLDADLQYPPEEIPKMFKKLTDCDIVVAYRKEYKASLSRRIKSKVFKQFFGGLLFKLPYDIQSGLKVFKTEVIQTLKINPKTGWTFDLEFLHRSAHAGYIIKNHDIIFSERSKGNSNINIRSIFEIMFNALGLRFRQMFPQHIISNEKNMLNSGIGYKKKQYITHTTLHHANSAIETFTTKQKLFLMGLLSLLVAAFVMNAFASLAYLIAVLSLIYFIDTLFNLYIVMKSIYIPQEIVAKNEHLEKLQDDDLPMYSILCPLYKEAHIIPQFLSAIDKISWPKNKLDVLLLLEEDDKQSILATEKMQLPSCVRVVVVPHSMPKTKPKACNYGLAVAKGEYLVIYDAEDRPDPMQLKKAYVAFKTLPRDILCLQAKLNYFNPSQNLLTRLFTAEYSLWFDVMLTGLQSLQTTIPLGGTSNHFRTKDLYRLEGWDPFNVTEDADLGMRLFKEGYRTAIIDSVTLEEANSKVKNWIRQRSRWIKGYMQTYLVHNRSSFSFLRNQKIHALYFHLVIGGKIAFILINPLLWAMTIAYFTMYAYVGPQIEALFPSYVFYMAVFSLVAGNFLFLYYYMIGCMKREQYGLVKYLFLVPIYWLLISIAGIVALYQLIVKPHYWEKTVHGLDKLEVKKNKNKKIEMFYSGIKIPDFRYFLH